MFYVVDVSNPTLIVGSVTRLKGIQNNHDNASMFNMAILENTMRGAEFRAENATMRRNKGDLQISSVRYAMGKLLKVRKLK
jgi:hypothetical protein